MPIYLKTLMKLTDYPQKYTIAEVIKEETENIKKTLQGQIFNHYALVQLKSEKDFHF